MSGISIGGPDAGKYSLQNTTATTTASIAAADLNVNAAGVNKVYDGDTTATVDLSSDKFAGDTVDLSYTSASFDTKDVDPGKAVSVDGISLSGADAGNYNLPNTIAATTADITARDLTVTATGVDKVYDGDTTATADLSSDKFAGDTVDLSYTSASFDTKDVGTGKAVSVEGIAIGGADATNYNAPSTVATTTANITAAELTVAGVTAADKTYDGTTATTLDVSAPVLTGVIGPDVVTLDASAASGSFGDKNVDTDKTVTIGGITISGADAGNYTLAQPSATASITAAQLTVAGVTAADKVYDGTTGATLDVSGASLSGIIAPDVVTLDASGATGAFAGKDVGPDQTVTVAGITIDGKDAGDYTLTQPSPTASITAADLTVTAAGDDKTYDGTTTATVKLSSDKAAGDSVDLGYASAAFDTKNVGAGRAVSVTGISMSGADAGDYSLQNTTAATTASIGAKALTITANNGTKTTGSTFTFTGGEFTAKGLASDDAVTSVALASDGAAASAAAGTYPIVVSGATGTGLGNYAISYTNGTLTVVVGFDSISTFSKPLVGKGTRRVHRGATVTFAFKVLDASGTPVVNASPKLLLTSKGGFHFGPKTVKYSTLKHLYIYKLHTRKSWKLRAYTAKVYLDGTSAGRNAKFKLIR